MALISMAVYCTEENQKDELLDRTLDSLFNTVDFHNHRLILSINSYTEKTKEILFYYSANVFGGKSMLSHVIYNDTNIGTAEAINKAWQLRKEGENCIKLDDDVVIYNTNWIEQMEESIARAPQIGIIGLKRKDCIESVEHEDEYFRSKLWQLPHIGGQRWVTVEEVHHVMGTCQMYSSALLDKIGYLYQPKLYGWDDVLASARSRAAGFKNVFLPHIEIDHIDEGKTPYQAWKEKHAGEDFPLIHKLMDGYKNGTESIYYNPFK
jgi:GT2 family glycosyltransferase